MTPLQLAFLLGVIFLMAFLVAGWLFSTLFTTKEEFSRVYPISAYVDARGNFLICVLNAGPHDFYGRLVVSTKSGRSVEIVLSAPVGVITSARGSLEETFVPGTSPVLILVTGGGRGYTLNPIVVPDISRVNC